MQESKSDKLQLVAIKARDKVFISDNINGERYFYTKIKNLLFDGQLPNKTYKDDWFELKELPKKIENLLPPKRINERYELKEGYQVTELTPKVIHEPYIDEDSEYYEVKGLYEHKFELAEPTFEELDFEINVIEEIDGDFEITKEEFDYKYNLLDVIRTHPVLLPLKPCRLTKEESYKIIRDHVKANINPKYARITSDYDFCFTVKKVIELYEPEQYEVNINRGTRRKPKYTTKFQRERLVTFYEIAPKPYDKYPVVEPFSGKNAEDLKRNIKLYLDELMEKINEPLVECEHCKGMGVILHEH